MAHRRSIAILAFAALAGCKDKGDGAASSTPGAVDFNKRCSQLAKTCSNQDKHIEKVFDGCTEAGQKQTAAGCTDKLVALYDCYEKQVCGGADKVWAFDDLRVLADRHKTCVEETKALNACTTATKK